MMEAIGKEIFNRTALLLGEDVLDVISRKKAILFGVGGVGSWCAEGLVRSGVSDLTIVDADCISVSNINRQLMATVNTVGRVKVDALKDHLLEINPNAGIKALRKRYSPETDIEFHLDEYDIVIDAIDSLKDKIHLILSACRSKAKFYCSLGAALKLDPTRIKVAEFWQVRGCPLGAAIRKRMKKAGTLPEKEFLCVFDDEVLPNRGGDGMAETDTFIKAQINGTTAHVTSVFGMTLAGLAIRDIYESVLK